MPRKAFNNDVAAASKKPIPNVVSVRKGDDDGDVAFVFAPPSGPLIDIGMLALDVSGYPSENTFMIFAQSPEVPDGVNGILEAAGRNSTGKEVSDLIESVAERLQKVLATGTSSHPFNIDDSSELDMTNDEGDGNFDSDEDEYDQYDDPAFLSEEEDFKSLEADWSAASNRVIGVEAAAKLNKRIRSDLRSAKFAGFKLGILRGLKAESQTSMLSISIQVSKLGLSNEALQAWDLDLHQHIVLLIRYLSGYKSFEAIILEPAKSLDISFRIGICSRYKPSPAEALAAFAETGKKENNSEGPKFDEASRFSSLFISSSLNGFLNDALISLVKIRSSASIGWDGAKLFYKNHQGRPYDTGFVFTAEYYKEKPLTQGSLPDFMKGDHQADSMGIGVSFPLHEIITQPFVVDLLVSLCYAAAKAQRIREYPTGMCLLIPPPTGPITNPVAPHGQSIAPTVSPPAAIGSMRSASRPGFNFDALDVKYDLARKEIIVKDDQPCSLRNGDWVVVTPLGKFICYQQMHHRVMDVSLYPTVKLSELYSQNSALITGTESPFTPATTPAPNTLLAAKLAVYDQNFDDMDNHMKAEAIILLLDTLPSIKEIREYLVQQSRVTEPDLRRWKERITPAALGLLRWIIASNRSCIVQVEKCPGQEDNESSIRPNEKCSNVPTDWVQFRFAQGAPDKEQRFLKSLKEEQSNLNEIYPTLFAFHGSPVPNWHSIIRHGLDFKETLHGRAFGHGVYHALEQNVSSGYAGSTPVYWPQSDLKIGAMMSLNEIVNCPSKYLSHTPYLVVQYVDWIQCRYLLVQTASTQPAQPRARLDISSLTNSPSIIEIEQDPNYTAKSMLKKPIGIPESAMSVSRAFRTRATEKSGKSRKSNKRRKHTSSNDTLDLLQTAISDDEDPEDINFLFSEDDSTSAKVKTSKKTVTGPKTDFRPGSLDQSKLPILQAPSYATPSATMRLSKELQSILKVQLSTPLHELGWYIDPGMISNVYQWIVELHSFEPSLPLAQDMKKAGLTSIVLEIRFGKDYPHSPPFVRVIRPRFLPFIRGGGGHVTGGGALCMELLTNSGWSAVSSIESVLLQVRMAIMNLEPNPARLESTAKGASSSYGTGEAVEAYIRACQAHGWEVPKDFRDFALVPAAGSNAS
ncbi:hypothetical protein OIDMADRAFT_158409 [Oidiodendron maius Zn]|uniref:UBC core domain-containing protein n=1 Tax=Oidiodendron maius (strain Zn) TaxID=913774 RepID=A0A0C3DNQ6_OIDMZ|nr:hypothetical protein OIDMADRAFT_158409 [Oidiodendron maius Zn]